MYGQAPAVYINFVSHNEPADNLQSPINFNNAKNKVLQLAGIINLKGASWNLQTCDGFATGAYNTEGVANNIFKTLAAAPFNDNIEIDPRNKNFTNIADLYWLLDTLGANPSNTLGGFLYSPTPDWFQYQNTIQGINHPWIKWNCNMMWGAGSPGHSNDYNDYGIWKPDSSTPAAFQKHNSKRNIWFIGNGCQPIFALDSTENISSILTPLKQFIDSIQKGQLPQNKFYCYSITINQSHFGPTLFQKVSQLCDTINNWGTSKVVWATLSQKFSAFQTWQTNPDDYSQWKCGQKVTNVIENNMGTIKLYPNPSNGRFKIILDDTQIHTMTVYSLLGEKIKSHTFNSNDYVNLTFLPKGIYIISIDNSGFYKITID